MKRLLVIRLSAFGDVIHTIPAVVALRKFYDIEWFVRAAYRELVEIVPKLVSGLRPDAARAIIVNRRVGLCLLCHTGPFPEERLQGNLAPDLAGAGARWTEGQLRLEDGTRIQKAAGRGGERAPGRGRGGRGGPGRGAGGQ